MNRRGFSLIELIVVISLISILISIATLSFHSWQTKYNIEAQVKEMLVDLDGVRLMAIQTKREHRIILNPASYAFWRYSGESAASNTRVFNKGTKYPIQQFSDTGTLSDFSNTTITVDERGYTSDLLTIAVGIGLGSPAYDCLVVQRARVNMGKINGNKCVY